MAIPHSDYSWRYYLGIISHRKPIITPNINQSSCPNSPWCSPLDDFSSMEDAFPSIRSIAWSFGIHHRTMRKQLSFEDLVKQGLCIMKGSPCLGLFLLWHFIFFKIFNWFYFYIILIIKCLLCLTLSININSKFFCKMQKFHYCR